MKKLSSLSMFIAIVLFTSCIKENPQDQIFRGKWKHGNSDGLKIAVLSDIHYMDGSLLKNNAASGAAFQAYIARDPKMVEYSDPIFRQCMNQIISDKPDILLIAGDLTKDGERVSHHTMSQMLGTFEKAHISVFVVPGNHDINNPEAVKYDGDNATPVPSISANEFAGLYARFGYANTISRDDQSLSYVTQAWPGLWLLALDANEYENNTNIAIVAGRLKPETKAWALQWIAEAKRRHVAIVGLMHHEIVEHYMGQNQVDPGYVVDDYETIAHEFTMAGLSIMFTGHYHANDITSRQDGEKILYDIETGSPVVAPSPYRIITVSGSRMDISTEYVKNISVTLPNGVDFVTYSHNFLTTYLGGYFGYALTNPPYSLPQEIADMGSPLLTDGYMAHFAGDEKVTPAEQAKIDAFGQIVPPLGDALNSIWTDLPPADNTLNINLPTQ